MQKKLLTYLVPIVLVIGTAFGAGMVVGDSEDSDVTVGVDCVCPEINDINVVGEIDYDSTVEIEVEIWSPGHANAVDSLHVKWEYHGGEPAGDACTYAEELVDIGTIDWEEDGPIGTVTVEFTPENMWRYGETCTWKAIATVHCGCEDCDAYDEMDVGSSVNEWLNIHWAENGIVEEVKPGTTVEGEEFDIMGDVYGDDTTRPQIKITSNANWELDFGDGLAAHEDAGVEDILDVEGDYEVNTGNPTWENQLNLDYEVEVPHGHMHGSYSTTYDGGSPVEHELSNTEL